MPKTLNVKPSAAAMEIRTFESKNPRVQYIVMRTGDEFHVFAEVEAKEAAANCGCELASPKHTPVQMWKSLWKKAGT